MICPVDCCYFKYRIVFFMFLLYGLKPITGYYKNRLYIRSITDLKHLEKFEAQVAEKLIEASVASRKIPNGSEAKRLLQLYLLDFFEGNTGKNMKEIFSSGETNSSRSPICAYKMIRRIAFLLKDVVSNEEVSKHFGTLSSTIHKYSLANGMPSGAELEDSIMSLLRIQDVYNLRAAQMANGWIRNVMTNCTLNSVQAYEISRTALKTGRFTSAIEWLETAKEKSLTDEKLDGPILEKSLWDVIEEHNKDFELAKGYEPEFFDQKLNYDSRDYKTAITRRQIQFDTFFGRRESRFSDINYWGLCSGENFQSDIEKSDLFCWYEYSIHPHFVIGPVKMEFLARNPDVVQMYEVIHEKEIENVISNANASMQASLVASHDSGDPKNAKEDFVRSSEYRTSVNAWYDDGVNKDLSRKIERLTGLTVVPDTASELFQVASYSFAGHYGPHLDSLQSTDMIGINGDRIATFLYYLNDVELGGDTVFTSLGASVTPIKGSAIFWYDLYSDGQPDSDTFHGACPVLIGEKWVANKWILIDAQFRNRKCHLNEGQRFQVPVNNVYLPSVKIPTAFNQAQPKLQDGSGVLTSDQQSSNQQPLHHLTKYSYLTPYGLKALAKLEWEIYPMINYIYNNQTKGNLPEKVEKFNKEVKMYVPPVQFLMGLYRKNLPKHSHTRFSVKQFSKK